MATNEELWDQMTDPILTPILDTVPAMMSDNPALTGVATPPILLVQMRSVGGKNLLLQLTEKGARKLVEVLAKQLQLRGSLLPPESNEPTKTH